MTSERLAIQLMIAQGVLFAAETAIIHHIGSRASVMQLALIRGTAGLVLAVALARNLGFAVMRTNQLPLQLLRGGVALLYLWVMIYSFSHLPFADATAISYTQAAYIAVFSVLILSEPVTRLRWAAAAVGIVGALFIAKPAFAGWNSAYLVALFGTSLNGLGFVLNRYLQREDTEATTMFYTNLVPVLANLPVLTMVALPDPETFLWIPGLLFFGPIGMYLGIVAVKHANASLLGPYTYLRLIIGVLGGVVIFRELPDIFSAFGAVLILAGCMLSSTAYTRRRSCRASGDIPTSPLCPIGPTWTGRYTTGLAEPGPGIRRRWLLPPTRACASYWGTIRAISRRASTSWARWANLIF
jgi:drug/metabolite transporter (DMT)-like permease